MKRDFKGIWIPREIWLNKNLCPISKMLWGEIYSQATGGECSRIDWIKKLSESLGVSKHKILQCINALKKQGYIQFTDVEDGVTEVKAIFPYEAKNV